MTKLIKYILLFLMFSFQTAIYAQYEGIDSTASPTDDELLAAQYYQNKEYDKAAVLYGKLYSKNQSPFYYNNYLNSLLELKDFSNAEKLVKKRIKKEQNGIKYRVNLGYVFQREQQNDKAEKEFKRSIEGH